MLIVCIALCLGTVLAQSPDAQKTEIQALKEKLQQMEKLMKELQGQIGTLEANQNKQLTTTAAVPPATGAPIVAAVGPIKSEKEPEGTFEIYGAAMLDSGYDFKTNNPDWFDVVRPTKLPSAKGEFAPTGKSYFGVRQSRLGIKTSNHTRFGELKTIFEFELFGTGVDTGQTTFRLRQAYGELGHFGAGQTWSPFMDIDVFPNTLEYWGPNGMVFFRNVQFRWMPIQGENRVTIAVERPGASADQGIYSNRVELQGVKAKFDMPDFSGEARRAGKWGYIKASGMFRKISWQDLNKTASRDLSGTVYGWGVNLSSNVKFSKNDTGRFQAVYGKGIQNYMNDAPVDVGIKNNFTNRYTPILGVPLPVLGIVAFLDHNWNSHFSSAAGFSMLNMWNSDAQAANAFRQGQYAVTNLLYTPIKNVMMGGEFQFGRRLNYLDGFSVPDYRLQFSVKYNFSKLLTY